MNSYLNYSCDYEVYSATPNVLFHMYEQINNRKLTCGPNSHKNTLKAALYKQQYNIKTP